MGLFPRTCNRVEFQSHVFHFLDYIQFIELWMPWDAETGEVPRVKPFLGRLSGLETPKVDGLALRFDYGDLAWFPGVLSAVTSLRVHVDPIRYCEKSRVSWRNSGQLALVHTFKMQEGIFVVEFGEQDDDWWFWRFDSDAGAARA